jgi:hypothetical protein
VRGALKDAGEPIELEEVFTFWHEWATEEGIIPPPPGPDPRLLEMDNYQLVARAEECFAAFKAEEAKGEGADWASIDQEIKDIKAILTLLQARVAEVPDAFADIEIDLPDAEEE